MKVKRIISFVVLASLVSAIGFAPGRASAVSKPRCESKTVAVTLSASDPATYQIDGKLCYRGSPEGKTVQVLGHGTASYKEYWDFPYQPQKYSYVLDQTNEGFATFAFNTFGADPSDRPPADQVTVQSNAHALHQVVQKLRDGSLSGTEFSKVVLVGHSSGSAVAMYEAATYADVDGVILSGILHDGALPVEEFSNLLYPASSDPKFATATDVGGYFTTKPGARDFFFNTSYAKSKVIDRDEQLKGTVSNGDLNTFFVPLLPGFTNQIHVPVLLAVGEKDKAYCNPGLNLPCDNSAQIVAREDQHFDSEACLEAMVQPVAAHNLNLHPNANKFFGAASDWIVRRVGNGPQAPTQPC
ncbi:MAG TPA: alpha/beta hydrolase [Candidatus Limnocylindria bacterium]|nr:alpha/beta hydrolase [Candidatus Limnocylindria bacterium]